MKAKVGRGKGFRGVLNYALSPKKAARIVGGNMATETARGMAAEFKISRELRSNVEKPVWHCSLALPAGEQIGVSEWEEISNDFMEKMGLGQHQFVAIEHNDTDYQHIHIIASRIGLDERVWHGKWEAFRAIEATRDLERKYGLTITPGLEDVAAEDHRRALKKGEVERSLRTGEASVRLILQNLVKDATIGNKSVLAFIDRLEAAGVMVRPNVARTGRMNGFSFGYNGVWLKGSQLGKSYSWAGLQRAGIVYEQDRDGAALIARAEQSGTSDRRSGPESGMPERQEQNHSTGHTLAGPVAPTHSGTVEHGPDDTIPPALAEQKAAWRQQHAALNAPVYRITLRSQRTDLENFNHGKGKGPNGCEQFYPAADVEKLLPDLSRQNARGYDIYVTPIDPAHHYIVVGGLNGDDLDQLRADGYVPSLVQGSGVGNCQAILKLPKKDGPDEQAAANKLVVELNHQFGNPDYTAITSRFRLAGFSNRKPGRDNVFTRILEALGEICQRAAARLNAIREAMARARKERVVRLRAIKAETETSPSEGKQEGGKDHIRSRSDRLEPGQIEPKQDEPELGDDNENDQGSGLTP
ncbi:hypothetical protein JCM17846_33550 [Iodidimonas nitroreducens]|uniref:Uncharacterized protein n=1 Tax=Iodidimonas nitroreducens TaxID=1236968 RepID=A0A5A7NB97_9PROT|nr:relaxase/mobilization nuclease domain-containing protein [Iodidimonas nitroreducens]GAK34375.1 DNA primase [alpha proteobacterium Q-1]GER05673.1 hypothetical protein JCM17846_33550 [Iodidimonas nitroreducens]